MPPLLHTIKMKAKDYKCTCAARFDTQNVLLVRFQLTPLLCCLYCCVQVARHRIDNESHIHRDSDQFTYFGTIHRIKTRPIGCDGRLGREGNGMLQERCDSQ